MATQSTSLLMMIVEDDKFIRKLLIEMFSGGPYTFVEAEDGQQAFEMMKGFAPDVIITDLMLPKLSGADLIRKLRMTKDYATTPIVAVTAGTDELKEQARKAGAHVVLAKPLREADVVKAVEELLAATPFIRRP